ncbi:hypothetical protein E9229_002622 [Paeniglutamicibacter cryotolerans]|uniref:META domain-containing protein n=2 Tax=Paeniglutamicibacter cryotolerans TaxID=670079 RepID=A0A839QWP6_9MICC|nr:hypothetical protein [Paeniglutamicibacter cryotolerans]
MVLLGLMAPCLAGCGDAGSSKVLGPWGGEGQVPRIAFEDAGTFGGDDGCNAFSGTWYQSGADVIVLDAIVGAVGCLEDRARLSAAVSFRVQDGKLLAFDGQGSVIDELHRNGP